MRAQRSGRGTPNGSLPESRCESPASQTRSLSPTGTKDARNRMGFINPKRQTDVYERSDARPVPEIDHLLSQISKETVSGLPEFLLGKNVYAGMPEEFYDPIPSKLLKDQVSRCAEHYDLDTILGIPVPGELYHQILSQVSTALEGRGSRTARFHADIRGIPQEFSQDESKAVCEEEPISKRPDGRGVQRNARSASGSPECSRHLERCNSLYEDAAHRRARHENSCHKAEKEARRMQARSASGSPERNTHLERCNSLYKDAAHRSARHENRCHKAEKEERRMLAAMQTAVKGTLQGPSDSRTHLERVADFVEKKEAARFRKAAALMNERKSLRKAQLQECTFTPKISRASQSLANLWKGQEKAYHEAGLLRNEISMTIHELNTQLENELSKYYQHTDQQQYCDGVEWSSEKEYLKNMVQGPVSSATIYIPKIGIPPYSPSEDCHT